MKSRDSALFTATALPAGLAAAGLTGWLAWSHTQEIVDRWPELLLICLFGILSYVLSFSVSGRDRTSLDLAYILAAILLFPFPVPLVAAAVVALFGSLLRGGGRLTAWRLIGVTGANIAVACTITTIAHQTFILLQDPIAIATSGVDPAAAPAAWRVGIHLFPTILMAAILFLVMNTANLLMMTALVVVRGESGSTYARRFLARLFPDEIVNIPFSCLLVFALRSGEGVIGFTLLGLIGFLMSSLLKRLSDSEEHLMETNARLEDGLDELATINAIGREISASLDAGRVFEIVRRECRMVFRPDALWIATVESDSLEVKLESSAAGDSLSRTSRTPRGEGLIAHLLETELPLLLRDAPHELAPMAVEPLLIEPQIRSVIAIPLRVESRVVGILCVQAFRESAYDEHHVSLLTTIGLQVAVAIENARHYQLATVDQLTGLFQRDYFFQRLGDEHRRASRYGTAFSLLMLDLDTFKKINDRFGHLAGDRFLHAVGACLKNTLRASDIPCRYGGEEFCLLLPETDAAGAHVIAEKIRAEVGALRVAEGPHRLATTLSIGIASFPAHFEGSLPGLLQKADQALYAAKRDGRDRVRIAQ